MSSGKFSGEISRRPDVLTYRQHFACMWQAFIISNFEDAAHAAYFFKVDPSTANNWFEGVNAPQGWVVGRAFSDPVLRETALCMLGAAK
jgi:hypothetical protein